LIEDVKTHIFKRVVNYHETDAMGIVHHSNHIKYFEEARVDFLRAKDILHEHSPQGPYSFAVIRLQTEYRKPARFPDQLEVHLQAHSEGVRVRFRYALYRSTVDHGLELLATGDTELAALGPNGKVARLPQSMTEIFTQTGWQGSWPPPQS
jgi:acyl-CoA thioester hydrolase